MRVIPLGALSQRHHRAGVRDHSSFPEVQREDLVEDQRRWVESEESEAVMPEPAWNCSSGCSSGSRQPS